MLYLLDDNDIEVVEQIESKLLDMGSAILPILEEQWHKENLTALHHEKIFDLLSKIKTRTILEEILNWKNNENNSALEGAILISKAFYPNYDYTLIDKEIESIRMDTWLQYQNTLSAWEKVRVLNDVFFTKYGYKGDRENYHSADNSMIHKVIENKKGNPISLSILYFTVAQKLNLPIFGVNLPQHFVMAFMPSLFDESTGDFSKKYQLNKDDYVGDPLFYIDAFSEGLPFDKDRLNTFLKEVKVEPNDNYYEPCSNLEIVQRIARNLKFSLTQKSDTKRLLLLDEIIKLIH